MTASTPRSSSQRASAAVGRRAHHEKAASFEAIEKLRLRQTEMEAHHFGLGLLHHLAHRCVERGAVAGWNGGRRINCELLVIGRKLLAPSCLARVVEHGR